MNNHLQMMTGFTYKFEILILNLKRKNSKFIQFWSSVIQNYKRMTFKNNSING